MVYGAAPTRLITVDEKRLASRRQAGPRLRRLASPFRHAVETGCNLVVCHKALTSYDYFPKEGGSRTPWVMDIGRLDLLYRHEISVLGVHSTVDPAHVGPEFIRVLGRPQPREHGVVWSFHEFEPVSMKELAAQARKAFGMELLRVTGEPDRMVTRIGTMVGEFGLDRHIDEWVNRLLPMGVELIITGETNDFAQRFATVADIALIETCHSASEDPGILRLSQDLEGEFPDTPVIFQKAAGSLELPVKP